jgi:hypothetical protein
MSSGGEFGCQKARARPRRAARQDVLELPGGARSEELKLPLEPFNKEVGGRTIVGIFFDDASLLRVAGSVRADLAPLVRGCGVRKLDRALAWWRCQAPRPDLTPAFRLVRASAGSRDCHSRARHSPYVRRRGRAQRPRDQLLTG